MRTARLALLCALAPALAPPASAERAVTDTDYRPVDVAEASLGWLLFYDPILSGNREIACATCHHPRFGTGDGMALGIGDGGTGLGPGRRADPANPPERRIPRNAPALFNLGAREFAVLFHDGRIEVDEARPSGIRTPLGAEMEGGFASLLSAQTMFPVLSPDEMAGHYSENEIAEAVRRGVITGEGGAWDLLAARVRAVPEYEAAFAEAMPGREVDFVAISDALAAFMAWEWRSDASPYDAHLRGERPLEGTAAEGLRLFAAECAACHAGPFQTDHAFHAMGAPQIGPGKAARFERHRRDDGRMRVTGDPSDRFAFRTPSLRNVTRTGPWGHTGAHGDLGAFLRHHSGASGWTPGEAVLVPFAGVDAGAGDLLGWAEDGAAIEAARVPVRPLDEAEVEALLAFLAALEDPVALAGRLGVPRRVPSGLPVPR
ncbi:cytochrome c peroxidase [Hasllibacter halocynthiae]|uniref:Cytochrome c peroxidase n=1 Tax=Hasllibacter halocynthiae TaxID=595589 RepID=A0A2T0X2V7_9RHOB|nr:cytochrome-c peroxidase [Hasllibacter halocynthiae]PRY93286.1 cytochrome c peroxidase [Hasllibacter halocynthiae]